ncbi:ABC transporter ATP-binding protein [bacterium]|nr:ABC transporter ATP-binding protein [bacterium]
MLLEIEKMTVRYGGLKAIDNIDLSIDSKALGLLGPNGAGKSTLIRALLGLLPAHGHARLEGHDIRHEGRAIRGLIGYMPEHEAWLGGMTVVRYLRLMGEMCGLPPRAAMERAHEVLFYVGLGEVRYRKLDGLSYGLHQKVRLAQALVHGPRILILDEPTSGLDPAAREEMLGLINDMVSRSQGKVIISSHILRDIEVCCKEVVVLKKGHVVAAGNIEQMRQTDDNLLELRVKGNMEHFMAELSAIGCECRMNERDTIQVATPDGLRTSAIYEIARRQKLQIRHLYARTDSLEDIFIKVMEDEAEPDQGAGKK